MANAATLMRNAGLLSLGAAIERRGLVPKALQPSSRGALPDVRPLFGIWPGLGPFVQYERKGYSIVLPLRLVLVEAMLRESSRAELQAVCVLFGIPRWYAEDFNVALRQARIKQPKAPTGAYLFDKAEITNLALALGRLDVFANQPLPQAPASGPEHALRVYRAGQLPLDAAKAVCGFDPSAPLYEPPYPVVPVRAPALLTPAVFYVEAPHDPEEHKSPTKKHTVKGLPPRRVYRRKDRDSHTPAPAHQPQADEFEGLSTVEVYPGDLRPTPTPQKRPRLPKPVAPPAHESYVAQEDAAAIAGLEPVYEPAEPHGGVQPTYTPPGPALSPPNPSPATPSQGRHAQSPPTQSAPLDLSTLGADYADLGAKLLQNILRLMADAKSPTEIKDLSVALKNVTGCVRGIPGIPNELASALRPAESPADAIADDPPEHLPQNAPAGTSGVLDDEARLLSVLAGGPR